MIHYRLLRNNKESGPYSALDLEKMGLKAYDLLWAEGRSAAWHYPSEIEELKSFAPVIEEQPYDRFYKKPAKEQKKPELIMQVDELEPTLQKKQKPRIKIKADLHKIEENIVDKKTVPVVKNEVLLKNEASLYKKPFENVAKEITSWKDAWLDWEQEKKAVKAASKPSTVFTAPKGEEVVLETKFSQSFEDIQDKYAETLLQSKTKKSSSNYKGYVSVAVIFIPVLSIGMWLGFKWSDNTETTNALINQQQQKLNELSPAKSIEIKKDDSLTEAINSTEEKNNTIQQKEIVAPQKNSIVSAKKINTQQTTIAKNNTVNTSSNSKVISKQTNTEPIQPPVENDHHALVVNNTNTTPSRVANKRVNNTAGISSNTENDDAEDSYQNNNAKNSSRKQANFDNINNYISVNELNTAKPGIKLQVENISEIPVDLVVMDLQYYDASGKFKKGETVYLHNIPSGGSATIKAPDDKNSSRITYKVSLLSAEQKGVYLIADN